MANPVIILNNTTVSDIVLTQLGPTVPGSGSITVTGNPGNVLVDEVINDPQLNTLVDAGDITLTVDGVALTENQSKAYVGYSRHLENDSATTSPTVNDDADAGYSVGSLWLNVTGDTAYICVDATNNAAVWLPIGGASAFGTPVTIGTTNQIGSSGLFSQSDHVHAHGAQTDGTLHAIATPDPGGVAGFMSPADKAKLDALVGTNGDTEFSSAVVSTTLNTYQDAFPGQNLTVPTTGTYLLQFEGNIEGSSGNTVNEIAISVNTIVIADSERLIQGNGGASLSTFCHTFANLTAGDSVTGVFRKASGSGTTSMENRRVTIIQLSILP
jgi:hypothetical protein